MDLVAAALDPRKEQDRLLNVGCQQPQVHDLCDSSPGYVPEAGELGVVRHLAVADQLLKANRQRHESGHARDSP